MAYRTWLELSEPDSLGRQQIVSAMTALSIPEGSAQDYLAPPADNETTALLLDQGGKRVYLQSGTLRRKSEVVLVASKLTAFIGEGDGIVVNLQGIPEGHGGVLLEVGTYSIELDDTEGLYLQWAEPTRLAVRVVDPWLSCSRHLVLQFVEPEEGEE